MELHIDKEYKELLCKYAGDKELRKLLDLAILEVRRKEMLYFNENKRNIEKLDALDSLNMDLITTWNFINNKK